MTKNITPQELNIAVRKLCRAEPWLRAYGAPNLWTGVPGVVGDPGVGKSSVFEWIAERLGVGFIHFIGAQRAAHELAGIPVRGEHGLELQLTRELRELVERARAGGPAIMLLDELTNVPPQVQAAMLSLLTERILGETRLPKIVALATAMNPPSQAVAGTPIREPMATRIAWYTVEVDGVFIQSWVKNFPSNWGRGVYDRAEGEARRLVAEFIATYPSWLHARPRVQQASWVGITYPNPRTWGYTAEKLAACLRADDSLEAEDFEAVVGAEAGRAFKAWLKTAIGFSIQRWVEAGMPASVLLRESWETVMEAVSYALDTALRPEHPLWPNLWALLLEVARNEETRDIAEAALRPRKPAIMTAMADAAMGGFYYPLQELEEIVELLGGGAQ